MTKKDMEKNIDEMTMAQIKEYIESLKNHIYHLTDVMSILLSTFNTVKADMNEFNEINKPIKKKILQETTKEKLIDEKEEDHKIDYEEDHSNENRQYDHYFIIEAVYKDNQNIDGVILMEDGAGMIRSKTPSYKEIKSGEEFISEVLFVNPSMDYMNELWNKFNNYVNKNYELISINRFEI